MIIFTPFPPYTQTHIHIHIHSELVSAKHDMTIVLMNSQQLCLPEEDEHMMKTTNIWSYIGDVTSKPYSLQRS